MKSAAAKPTLAPRLRFPEFRKAPGWEEKSIGQVVTPAVREKAKPSHPYTGLGIRNHGKGTFLKEFENPEKNSMDVLFEVKPDDLILNITFAWEGSIAIAKECDDGALVSHRFPTYTINSNESIPGFLRHNIVNKQFVYKLGVISPGGAGRNRVLNKNDFLKLPIVLPEIEEQHKIASCLSSLDDLIAAERQKLEALKAHKNGLMQQLFPREGETLPRLRFPEFRNGPRWEECALGEVCTAVFDGTHQTPTYTAEGVPFYSVENLISGNANKFISREDYLAATRKNKPEMGDILLTRIGKIGYSQVVTWAHEFSVYVTLAVIKRSSRFDSHYMHYFFQSDRYQSELMGKSLQSAVPPKINMESLRSTKVILPRLNEQVVISDCMKALDALIAAQSDKVEALKTHKKGLMQQLFPSPEAIES